MKHGLNFSSSVRSGIFVETKNKKLQAPSGAEYVAPDGAGNYFGLGATKMPRLRRWTKRAIYDFGKFVFGDVPNRVGGHQSVQKF